MVNEIVKFSNQFNNVALRKFDSMHLDVLMAIASRVKEKGTETVTFTFEEMRSLMRLKKNLTNEQLAKKIIETNRRLLALNYEFTDDEGGVVQFALFTVFRTTASTAKIEVSVNPLFAFLLNDLTSNFTRFELKEFAELSSRYAKECYRRLKQYRQTGVWKVSLEDFRRLMDVPKSYRVSHLNQFVLQPIEEELGDLIHLKVERVYKKKGSGRGRSSLVGFEFHFDKELTPRQEKNAQMSVKALEKEKQALAQQEELEASQKRSQALYGALGGFNAAYVRSSLSAAGMGEEKVSELLKTANQEAESGDLADTREALQAWISREIHAWKAHLDS